MKTCLSQIYTFPAVVVLLSLLVSCATTPVFDTSGVNEALTPARVLDAENSDSGEPVLWGGTILDTQNLAEFTQIEVLAFPLHSSQRPLRGQKPLGRFLVRHNGFLEPTVFNAGKSITVLGEIGGVEDGQVGDASYRYPIVNAGQIQLWSASQPTSQSSFHFGIGIGF